MEIFQNYAYYYNTFYQDKDYAEEAKQVDILLKIYGENIKKIINFGCGTGKHDIELSKLGYHCTGIDISPFMINIAEKNANHEKMFINFSVNDARKYESGEKYDAVISLFHVMSYQNSNEDIIAVFQSAKKVLKEGGLLLFDIWYGPGVLTDKPSIRVKEVEDDKYRLIRIAKPILHDKSNLVDVYYEIFVIDKQTGETKTINEMHSMRYFFRPELEFYLDGTGFKLVDGLDCTTLKETSYNSWTSYIIAKSM